MTISYQEFENVDIRAGTIIKAEINVKASRPSILLEINFGNEIGIKRSSAQLTKYYEPDKLIGKKIAAVVNFPPKQIGKMISEVLVLGFPDENNEPILISPDLNVNDGVKLF